MESTFTLIIKGIKNDVMIQLGIVAVLVVVVAVVWIFCRRKAQQRKELLAQRAALEQHLDDVEDGLQPDLTLKK